MDRARRRLLLPLAGAALFAQALMMVSLVQTGSLVGLAVDLPDASDVDIVIFRLNDVFPQFPAWNLMVPIEDAGFGSSLFSAVASAPWAHRVWVITSDVAGTQALLPRIHLPPHARVSVVSSESVGVPASVLTASSWHPSVMWPAVGALPLRVNYCIALPSNTALVRQLAKPSLVVGEETAIAPLPGDSVMMIDTRVPLTPTSYGEACAAAKLCVPATSPHPLAIQPVYFQSIANESLGVMARTLLLPHPPVAGYVWDMSQLVRRGSGPSLVMLHNYEATWYWFQRVVWQFHPDLRAFLGASPLNPPKASPAPAPAKGPVPPSPPHPHREKPAPRVLSGQFSNANLRGWKLASATQPR